MEIASEIIPIQKEIGRVKGKRLEELKGRQSLQTKMSNERVYISGE